MRRTPSYRLHKPSGQAVVTLSGKDHYLGPHGSAESKAEYDRLVGAWQANGRRPVGRDVELTVDELLLAYWKHAQTYYRKGGKPTSQLALINRSLRVVHKLYGDQPVAKFGPLALRAVRQSMIDEGLCRGTVNSNVSRIVQAFRWGVEHEMIPESIHAALKAVRGLSKGRCEAIDHPDVGPAPDASVQAVLPLLRPTVRAMVELQLLAGLRPGEVTIMRAEDIDRSGSVWMYTPHSHKTEHRGKSRTIHLGPKAQAVLQPWLERFPDGYLFRPRGWATRPARQVKAEHCDPSDYARVIRNACDKGGVPRFSPNQLRHSAATRIRREFGLDASRTVLGHADLKTSEIYAERDAGQAAEVMSKIG